LAIMRENNAPRAAGRLSSEGAPTHPPSSLTAPLGHRPKAARGFYRRHRSHAGHYAPFSQMYGSLKTVAGASWPERIAVLRREKVVRRALAAPQRAPRLLA